MENIDWGNLGFGYLKTDFNIRCYFRNGAWEKPFVTSDESITMHMAASSLHYGQEAFEGLKAYRGADGQIRLFRVEENAKRMSKTANYICMADPSTELFTQMVLDVVKANERFVPPYGSGATLYIRPLLIGTGARVGVSPADEYLFMIFVTPVGPYYKGGFSPIKVIVDRDHDRSAPQGTGHVKTGGNYAASLKSGQEAHAKGYPSVLYLDAKEKKYIDECGAANFFAIRGNSYITPDSRSILPSITNLSLRELAQDMGLNIEQRAVEYAELATFDEVASCGTAAVISPIGSIYDPETGDTITYNGGTTAGEWSTKLYEKLRGIQWGEIADTYGWTTIVK